MNKPTFDKILPSLRTVKRLRYYSTSKLTSWPATVPRTLAEHTRPPVRDKERFLTSSHSGSLMFVWFLQYPIPQMRSKEGEMTCARGVGCIIGVGP